MSFFIAALVWDKAVVFCEIGAELIQKNTFEDEVSISYSNGGSAARALVSIVHKLNVSNFWFIVKFKM